MKATILSGFGDSAKQSYLLKIKHQFDNENITAIDLKTNSLADLARALISPSLFGSTNRLIIVTNIPKSFDLKLLSASDPSLSLLVVLNGEDNQIIKKAKENGFSVLEFSGEKEVTAFAYLDYLLEGKTQAFLELEKLLNNFGGLYIISMIYYGLRRNFLPLPASSFVQKKIISQKSRFDEKRWQKQYLNTLKAEQDLKTGVGEEKFILTKLTQSFLNS